MQVNVADAFHKKCFLKIFSKKNFFPDFSVLVEILIIILLNDAEQFHAGNIGKKYIKTNKALDQINKM